MTADHGDGTGEELAVDVTFEDDLRAVESAVAAHLETPSDDSRAALHAALEQLDAQIERSEEFDSASSIAFAFGSAPRIPVVGETSDTPVVEEVLPAEFDAQVTLVRAAKELLRDPAPASLDELRTASEALSRVRSEGQTA